MDAFEINRLFSDQKFMKKYLKKDYIRVYDGRVQATHAKLTCHTLTDKLIDFSKGELVSRRLYHINYCNSSSCKSRNWTSKW